MPYFTVDDLPDPVKHVLPKDAQEIYRKAFNRAWDTHEPDEDDRLVIAAKIAWAAVKERYVKGTMKWLKKDDKRLKKQKKK